MDSYSEISTLLFFTGTQASSSPVPGLSQLSGKAIHRLGAVLNGVDNVLANRHLNQIQARCRKDGSLDTFDAEGQEMCNILLELIQLGYPISLQTRALCIIMEQIGAMNYKSLAAALATNPLPIAHRHLSTITECLWSSQGIGVSSDAATIRDTLTTKKIAAYHAAGYQAYMTATVTSPGTSVLSSSLALILYLAYIATIGSGDLARIIMQLDITRFLDLIGLFNPFNFPDEMVAGRLLLHVLALKLDPTRDLDTMIIVNDRLSSLKRRRPSTTASKNYMEYVWTRLETTPSAVNNPSLLTGVVLDTIKAIKAGLFLPSGLQRATSPAPPIEEVKVLLLGGADCGKTTIMKQIILSERGSEVFTSKFKFLNEKKYIEELVQHLHSFLNGLLETGRKMKGVPIWAQRKIDSEVMLEFHKTMAINELISFLKKHIRNISFLKFLASDAVSYQLDVLKRIEELPSAERDSYQPTEQDLLRYYVTTTGGHETTFETPTRKYRVWDCGGRRPERKKWIGFYPSASVLLSVASLVDYDQVLSEDGVTNRLQDDLLTFDFLCNSLWFMKTQIILVLTKRDCLTKQRLSRSPLEQHFPDYTGGADEDAAIAYITERFLSLSRRTRHRGKVQVCVLTAHRTEEVEGLLEMIRKEVDSPSVSSQSEKANGHLT